MLLQARPSVGKSVGNCQIDCLKTQTYHFHASIVPQAARRATITPRATENSGLTSNSSLLGPSLSTGAASLGPKLDMSRGKAPSVSLEDVPLESKVNVDYSQLKQFLSEGKWREAEDETRAKLIEAAGPGAVQRNWVYWSEVKSIPVEDLRTLDALWSAASNGKFGYKVQREIWVQNRRQWTKFFKSIDWVQGENNVYRKWPQEFNYSADAPKGHLPLTNALRGTRLFEAIMEHPAFAEPKNAGAAGGNGTGAGQPPSWLK